MTALDRLGILLTLFLGTRAVLLPESREPGQAHGPDSAGAHLASVQAASSPGWSGGPWAVEVGRLPRPVTSFGAVCSDGWVYVLGGYFGTPHSYCYEHQSRDFYRFRVDDPSHLELLPNEARLQGSTLVAVDDRIVRLGGMEVLNSIEEPQALRSIAEVRTYLPEKEEWTQDLPDLPEARSSHEALVHAGKLYVIGGWGLGDGEPRWHEDVLILDLAHPSRGWERVAAPLRKRALGAVVVEGSLLVFGGIHGDGAIDGGALLMDLSSREWSRGSEYPGDAFAVAALAVDGVVYASGRDGTVYRLASKAGGFEPIARWRHPRLFHRLIASGMHPGEPRMLLAMGGIGSGGRPAAIESLTLDETGDGHPAPAGRPVHVQEIHFPGDARNRQAALLIDQELYFLGGNKTLGQHDFTPSSFSQQCWKLNLATQKWSRLADLPASAQSLALLATGNRLECLGGFGPVDGRAVTLRSSHFYAQDRDRWSPGPEVGEVARSQGFVCSSRGRAWWVGGQHTAGVGTGGADTDYPTSILVRDESVSGSPWEPSSLELRQSRCALACALLDDRIFAVGGMGPDFELRSGAEVVDLVAGTVSSIAAPRIPRIGAKLVPLAGRLYLVGGMGRVGGAGLVPVLDVEVYDPAQDEWRTYPERLPFDPRHIQAFAWNGRVLVVGTPDRSGRIPLVTLEPMPLDSGAATISTPQPGE